MKQLKHKLFVFLLGIAPAFVWAQQGQNPDVTGVWTGLLYVDSTKAYLPYEMVFSEEKGKITGFSRIVFEHDGIKEIGIRDITAKFKGDSLVIEDDDFIESNFNIQVPRRIKKTMVVAISITDSNWVMKGKWSTNRTRVYLPATGSGSFTKKFNYQETAIFKRLDTLKRVANLSFTKPAAPTIAVAPPPPPKIVAPPAPVIEQVPDLIIPALEPISGLAILPLPAKKPSSLSVTPWSKARKQQMEALSKVVFKVIPKEPVAVAPPPPKPAPVVVAAPVKKEPVVSAPPPTPKPVAPPVVTQPAPVAVVAPKPVVVAPPAVVIAPSVQQGAAEIDKRAIKLEQALYFENDSLVLTLYDNGDVDGDTVTVVMNGGIIFSKQGLSTRANTKTVYIPANADSVKFVMYAENLGEIPPNTGLMVVMDGEKRYDLRFSADLKSSAAIVFRRKKN
jgi:hypothetical protein